MGTGACGFVSNDQEFSQKGPACITTETELDDLDSETPDGDTVSKLVSISSFGIGKLEKAPLRKPRFKLDPDLSGQYLDLEVSYEGGNIKHIASETSKHHDPDKTLPCTDELTIEVDVRVLLDKGQVEEVVQGTIHHHFKDKSANVEEGSVLVVELPQKQFKDAFELIVPKDLSKRERKSVKLVLVSYGQSSGKLSVEWLADLPKKQVRDGKDQKLAREDLFGRGWISL